MPKMSGDDVFRLYERLYFWEIERRDRISARVPVLLVIVLALVSLQSYLLDKLLPLTCSAYVIVSAAFLGLSAATLIAAVLYLVMSWHEGEYAYLPMSSTLEEHRSALRKHFKEEGTERTYDEDEWLATELGRDLFEYYVECGSQNFANNKLKSKRLHIAFNWLLAAIGSGVVSFILFKVKEGIWKVC